MRVGDELRIGITDLSAEGHGLVVVDGRNVHVAGAMPRDQVRARVTNLARQSDAAYARLESILEPSPARRRAPCAADVTNGGGCTGCPLSVLDEAEQRAQKRALVARALGRDVDEFVFGEPLGYRASSKRIVFGKAGAVSLGSYARATHKPADMAGCLVDHPRIARAADDIAKHASALGIEPFDDVTGQGSLRYVWFKTNGEDVLVTLVGRVHDDASIRALALVLDVAGVALAENTETGNALRGTRITPFVGAKSITVAEGGVGAEVGPLGFLQPNPGIAARAYASLVRDAEGAPMRGALALDLYAGLGLTTTMLGATFTRVVPCESYAESAEALGIAPSTVEVFLDGVRSGDASALAEASFVVANPPRGGFGDVVVSALTALAFPALSIMSCSPASLARDLAGLLAPAGPYTLVRLEAYDTLPQTAHVELVAKLVRSSG